MIEQKKDLVVSPVQEERLTLITSRESWSADNLRAEFTRQFNPVGPLHQILVEELARRRSDSRV